MLLHPGRLGQHRARKPAAGPVPGLGLVRGLEHLRVAAFHGRGDERVTVWKVR